MLGAIADLEKDNTIARQDNAIVRQDNAIAKQDNPIALFTLIPRFCNSVSTESQNFDDSF